MIKSNSNLEKVQDSKEMRHNSYSTNICPMKILFQWPHYDCILLYWCIERNKTMRLYQRKKSVNILQNH